MRKGPCSEATRIKIRQKLLEYHQNNPGRSGFGKGGKNVAFKSGKYRLGYPRDITRKERIAGRPRPELCEICDRSDPYTMCFDHDHITGKFRGWICHRCNKSLGLAEDSPEQFMKLIKYLKKSK